jgi:beta-glucosidase
MFGGNAIADVIFGDYNPGGKLTCNFPKSTGQLPMNFLAKPAANDEPTSDKRVNVAGLLWPFGYGLSYTKFEYSKLEIEPRKQTAGKNLTVKFFVTNTGSREGDEIPELYVHQDVGSVTTWDKRLCGFERIHLKPRESKMVTLNITPECLAILNQKDERVIEAGKFDVMVAASSDDIRLAGEFEIFR